MTHYTNPHHVARGFGDRFAYAFVRLLRFFADLFFAKRYGHRAIVLETQGRRDPVRGWVSTDLAQWERLPVRGASGLLASIAIGDPADGPGLVVALSGGTILVATP